VCLCSVPSVRLGWSREFTGSAATVTETRLLISATTASTGESAEGLVQSVDPREGGERERESGLSCDMATHV